MINKLDNGMAGNFGFGTAKGSIHTKRTMMLHDLSTVLDAVYEPAADISEYVRAITADNILHKPSMATRRYSAEYLKILYALDPNIPIFHALKYLWTRDAAGRPLVAFLSAYVRDPLLEKMTDYIIDLPIGLKPSKKDLEELIEKKDSGRFSEVMKSSLGRNLLSSWTQAGYLAGKVNKVRNKATPTPGAAAFALLLGYVKGVRGYLLFKTPYVKLLDCPVDRAIELAEDASRRGWLVFKRVHDVVEVRFPELLIETGNKLPL